MFSLFLGSFWLVVIITNRLIKSPGINLPLLEAYVVRRTEKLRAGRCFSPVIHRPTLKRRCARTHVHNQESFWKDVSVKGIWTLVERKLSSHKCKE